MAIGDGAAATQLRRSREWIYYLLLHLEVIVTKPLKSSHRFTS